MGCLDCRSPWKFVNPLYNKFDNYSRTRMTLTLGRVVTALIGAMLAASVGCTSSKLNSTGPSGSKCQVTVSNADSTIAAAGGTTTVAIAAQPECAWTASTDAAWITNLAPPSGQGNSAVQVSAAPNADPVTRRGMIHIAGTDVQITQAAAPCVFQVTPLSRDVGGGGGTTSVSIAANGACGWTAASTVSWIRVTSGASGTGNGSATMTVDANGGSARQGVVTVAGQAVTISQSPLACNYSLSPTTGSIGAVGGAGPAISVTATGSCSWTATSPDSWITILSGAGSGNGSVTYNVAANTGVARSGSIVIAGQTFTLTQAAAVQTPTCTYSINPTSQSFASGGGPGTIGVTTINGCAWTAVSNAAWITVTGGAAGTGNGTVSFRAAANTGAARSGTITIAGQTFTVSEALACTYDINPTSKAFGLTGGTGTVQVTAPASCAWTAVSNAADWLKVTGGASGSGNGTVAYTADSAGENGKNRSGTVTIATQTFTVSESNN
jgi:Putative binding domain, N-terminal/Viral BACON domain